MNFKPTACLAALLLILPVPALAADKAYKIGMATFGHWTKAGNMDEEYLFWDNQEFMKEIGLGQ